MSIDFKTLFLLTLDGEAMLGVLLLFSWMQNTAVRAVAWWGCAYLLRSLSIGLYGMYGALPDLITITVADVILFGSYAVTWTGARIFDGRGARPGSLITGATVWLLACQFAEFAQAPAIRASLSAAIIAAFMWLTAYEFWRSRAERLLSRWPAIFILFANGAMFLLRSPPIARLAWPVDEHVFSSAWLTVISSESLLATISTAFILLAMAKERAELRHKTAALVDPLTGLANRRAFLSDAAQLTRTQIARDRPVARLGGEEFVVLLADACRDNAFAVAERVRAAFAVAGAIVDGHAVNATASIGVAIIQDPDHDVAVLIDQAD